MRWIEPVAVGESPVSDGLKCHGQSVNLGATVIQTETHSHRPRHPGSISSEHPAFERERGLIVDAEQRFHIGVGTETAAPGTYPPFVTQHG